MKIAVVIPSYNHSAFIERAVDSVLEQSRKVDFIVVVDDGSSDNSAKLLQVKYGDNESFYLHEQKNAGAHNTINLGVKIAAEKGADVIGILNSDDFYHPERMEKCVPALGDDKAIVCAAYDIIGENNKPLEEVHPRRQWFAKVWKICADLPPYEGLGLANFIGTTSNILARTTYLLSHPFRPYRYCHDYFFLIEAALRGKLEIKRETLLSYRVHGGNTMNTEKFLLAKELQLMLWDLRASLVEELQRNADLRRRYALFSRRLWDNVSNIRASIFYELSSILLAKEKNARERFVNLLETHKDELDFFPNTNLLKSNYFNDLTKVKSETAAQKLDDLRQDKRRLQSAATKKGERDKWTQDLLASFWGRFALFTSRSLRNEICRDYPRNNPRLDLLKVVASRTLSCRIGAMLGSGFCRNLSQRNSNDED